MARQQKKSGKPAAMEGFEEAPQRDLEGAPVSGGSIEDWVRQLEEDAAREQRDAEMRDIRSRADKHRKKAEKSSDGPKDRKGERTSDSRTLTPGESGGKRKTGAKQKTDRVYEVGDKRTGGGVSIGGTNDPKERAAAGLNPVAGLDVGLEEAEDLLARARAASPGSPRSRRQRHSPPPARGCGRCRARPSSAPA